jgi:hypothetical protein
MAMTSTSAWGLVAVSEFARADIWARRDHAASHQVEELVNRPRTVTDQLARPRRVALMQARGLVSIAIIRAPRRARAGL